MKITHTQTRGIALLSLILSLTACGDRKDGPSEIVNARPISPYYSVKKGETLADIAAKHNMKTSELVSLNNLKSPYTLFERQRILIRPLGKVTDYAKANSDISVKELDADPKKEDENKDDIASTLNAASDPMTEEAAMNFANSDVGNTALGSSSSPSTAATPSASALSNSTAGAAATSVAYDWPVTGKVITKYHQIIGNNPKCEGLQIKAPVGTHVKAAAQGTIEKTGQMNGFGKIVVMNHSDGKRSLYAHLNEISVKKGQTINQGQEIGRVGKGPGGQAMLFFQMREMSGKSFVTIDPAKFLP